MNNPFSRLKHYLPGEIDSQENHATECLAACLVFSSKIRGAFIQFLFNEKINTPNSAEIEVITQHWIEGGGYIDLVMRQESGLVVVVEIKVKASEDERHIQQIKAYKKWVWDEAKSDGYLFTLVRKADAGFSAAQYGATGRRTWRELHKYFRKMLNADDLSDVESSLIKNFCDYLESEGIVSTYETKDLFSYAAGMRSRKAVTGIFNQVKSLFDTREFRVVPVEDRKDYWPQLRIQRQQWKEVFGDGENRKVSLWFCVPGIWGQTELDGHDFYPEIELWHEDHRNDWLFVKSKLPIWLGALKSQGFSWTVYQTWNKRSDNTSADQIQFIPKKIVVYMPGDNRILNQRQPQTEDDLVDMLTDRIKQYVKIVDSLGK